MKRAALTNLGIIDESVQDKILKMHFDQIGTYRSQLKELIPYREAVQSMHLGYNSDKVPTPENPSKALKEIITSLDQAYRDQSQQVMMMYNVALGFLKTWTTSSMLSKEKLDDLYSSTAEFLRQHVSGDINECKEKHVHGESCQHGA